MDTERESCGCVREFVCNGVVVGGLAIDPIKLSVGTEEEVACLMKRRIACGSVRRV